MTRAAARPPTGSAASPCRGALAPVHRALRDPAHAGHTEEERLQAFREVRDELRRRLALVFGA